MFTLLEEYDVQATRREVRDETKLEDAINIIKEANFPLSNFNSESGQDE